MRTLYDDIYAGNVPAGGDLYAGYGDGRYQDAAALAARFPRARVLRITVFASDNQGDVLDVETGDATPAQAPGWVVKRRAAGVEPWVYMNFSTWGAVRDAFKAAGVPEPHYWVAQYDHDATIPFLWALAGCVAKQYESTALYDISSVLDHIDGFDAPPAPPPAPPVNAPTTLGDTVTRHPVSIALDANGSGWATAPIPFAQVVAVFGNGADPSVAGRYWPLVVTADDLGGNTQVEVSGGVPHGSALVFVTTAP
jgi:hypothetical protein